MNKQQKALLTLATIKAGVNYPARVTITEKVKGKPYVVEFLLNSFYVGMYAAIHVNGQLAGQTGDYNNKRFVTQMKRDIAKAIGRGATVDFGPVFPVKSTME